MKQYTADGIRNIALVGHSSAGKTSLGEAMLYFSGAVDRLGKVADGNTVLDFDSEEIKRKVSIMASVAPVEWGKTKINIIDTPGLFDYYTGVYEGMRPAETALIVVSAKSGVSVGTEKVYKMAKSQKKATSFFINKMDSENANYYKVLDSLKETFGTSVCPAVIPFVEGGRVSCYINLINNKAYKYDDKGKATEVDIPKFDQYEELLTMLNEAVAETDDELMEKYFSGETFTSEEIVKGVHKGLCDRSISLVYCGSAQTLEGMDMLLNSIAEIFPSAGELCRETLTDNQGKEVEISCKNNEPLAATVFKTVADPFVGKLSYFKVLSGKLLPDSRVINSNSAQEERIGKVFYIKGKKLEEAEYIDAGDIGAVSKLSVTKTGDTLCADSRILKSMPIEFPAPCTSMAVKPLSKGDEEKISQSVNRLMEEDPSISFEVNNETHQMILSGLGDQHIDVIVSKLKSKFGVGVSLEQPRVAYRETIQKKVKVEGKHKKQTGGHGQYGHVWIEFEPHDGLDLIFEEKIFGGAVPKGYFPAVEKGLRECIQQGVLAGYPVVGLKATLVDGSYHPVDSSEMSFKMAASIAYKEGLKKASPILLEPIGTAKVLTANNNTGDILGELNKKRGRVLGMNPVEDNMTEVVAEVPMSEMHDFSTVLRSITQGRGRFTLEFTRYEPAPANIAQKVIEESKKAEE